ARLAVVRQHARARARRRRRQERLRARPSAIPRRDCRVHLGASGAQRRGPARAAPRVPLRILRRRQPAPRRADRHAVGRGRIADDGAFPVAVNSAAVTQKWLEGRVAAQHRWTERLFSLKVDADIPFEAGQFAKLALEVDGEMLARPYSFVNAPGERPNELHYLTLPDRPLTHQLFRP